MAYGDLKCNNLIYETGSGDVTVAVSTVPSTAGATFTGDVTLTGAANNVVWDKSDNALEFADNAKATFGDSDLQIYHDQTNSLITNTEGYLGIRSNTLYLQDNNGSGHAYVTCVADGAVGIRWNNLEKLATTTTGVNITGTAEVDGITIDGAYEQVAEAVAALAIDCSTGNYFTKTISANSTFTFTNPAASGSVTSFTLELTHSSGTITWPTTVVWNGGVGKTAPTVTAGKTHLFMFVTDDGGTTYRGSVLADYDNAA